MQRYFTVMCLASSGKQPPHRANQEAEVLSNALIFTQDSDAPSSDRAGYIQHSMKELNITHQYVEVAGGDHGSVLTTGMADIFAFFNKHSKAASK